MKRTIKVALLLSLTALVMTGCNCYKKMAKKTDQIQASVNPALLTLKGSEVVTDLTVDFAPKFVDKKAIIKITPVLVFDGGETKGTAKYVQGEKISDNYTVISRAGGGYKQEVSFPFDKRAKRSTLELRFELKCGSAGVFRDLTTIVVAEGVSTIQNLADWTDNVAIMPDNFKRVTTLSESADIMYLVNSSQVRDNALSADKVKMLKDFVKDNSGKERVELGSIHTKGYASPEGPTGLNTKLSQDRSRTGKVAISRELSGVNVKYDEASFGEDWDGFKKLVEASSIKDKDLILQVLNMYSSPTQREQEIKNMSQVFEVLKQDILPKLRRTQVVASASISGKTDEEIMAAAKSDINSLNLEEMLYAATLTNDRAQITDIYKTASEKFKDVRAYNNYGAVLAKSGKLDEAKTALNKAAAIKPATEISNNLGLVALADGDSATARKHLSSLSSKEAKANMSLLALSEGNYAAAVGGLDGYNLAVAEVCNGNLSKAKTALGTNKNANADYLRAVISMREGNTTAAISSLKTAFEKAPQLKAYALNDIEFTKIASSL